MDTVVCRGVFRPVDSSGHAVRSPLPLAARPPVAPRPAADSDVLVETERLLLRAPRAADFDAYYDMSADAETFRYSERGPMSRDEAWSRLLRHAGHWSLLGHGLFVAIDKASGRFAGEAGLGDFRRGLGTEFDSVPEAGWAIAPWARGRGLATEAAAAALKWMERRYGADRTVCLIHAGNVASIRVAGKLGYRAFKQREYRGFDAWLFERPRGGLTN